AELVEQRLYFAVREQRRLAPARRREIRGEHGDVPDARFAELDVRDEAVHPRAVALVFAREDVHVEERRYFAAGLADRIGAHVRVPHRRIAARLDVNAIEALGDGERALEDALEREIRPERLFVEIVSRAAKLFGVIADVPRLERRCARTL